MIPSAPLEQAFLFHDISVLTPSLAGGVEQYEHGCVAVSGSRIVYAGQSEADARMALPDGVEPDLIDGTGRLLMPPFANAHGHIAMALMRNTADDRNLHDWLFNVIIPREDNLSEAAAALGTQLGLCEMIRGGTGAAADMYYFADRTVEAVAASGMRGQIACEAKWTDPSTQTTQARPADLAAFIKRHEGTANGRIRTSLMVHSVYLYQQSLYAELADMVRAAGCPIQVHIAETEQEIQDSLKRTGLRPAAFLAACGLLDGPVIAAHCVHLNQEDRCLLARPNIMAVHCPASNMKLGSGLADVPAMLKAGMRVGLGTDGAASNNRLDMFREMMLASFIAKATYKDGSALASADVLRMATCEGMAGLGFAESGYIAAGRPADLQVIDLRHPAMQPAGRFDAAVVYCGEAGFVESLMVDGKFLMYRHELKTIDEERVLAECNRLAAHS